MKNALLVLLFVFLSAALFANGDPSVRMISIEGRVVDAGSGEELTGVMIRVKDTDIFTYSDRDGHFEIPACPAGSQLEFLLVSFEPFQMVVDAPRSGDNEIRLSER